MNFVKGLLFLLLLVGAARAEMAVFLLDTSGSMQGMEGSMVRGVNDVLDTMRRTLERAGPNVSAAFGGVEIYTFNERDGRQLLLRRATLNEPLGITVEQYRCWGGTPLYDALADTLQAMPPRSTLVLATDGEENTSRRHNRDSVRRLMDVARTERDIEFIYVYKNTEAFTGGVDLGFMDFKGHAMASTVAVNAGARSLGYVMATSADTIVGTVLRATVGQDEL